MSTTNDKPAWLKRMENGSIGEATATEFLIDRFWILERSVDLHGADLIIQRRVSSENILDKNPPKFGVVQVKYYQDEKTTQYIPKDYILDGAGNPRKEFFVFAVCGVEDEKQTFLLTTDDIIRYFKLITDEEQTHYDSYSLSGVTLLSTASLSIKHKRTALDKIENMLKLSSFIENRRFISYVIPEINKEIDTPYIINVANDVGDFQEMQNNIKKRIKVTIYEMEETIELLQRSLIETDPLKIEQIVMTLPSLSYGGKLSFSLDVDNNFFEEAKMYKSKVDELEQRGFLQNFIKLQDQLISFVKKDTVPNGKISDEQIYIVNLEYNLDLSITKISSRVDIISNVFPNVIDKVYSGFIEENVGKFSYYYVPSNHSYSNFNKDGLNAYRTPQWKDALVMISGGTSPITIMKKIFDVITSDYELLNTQS